MERDRVILAAIQPCKERFAERLHNVNMMSVYPNGAVRYWYRDGNVNDSYEIDRCLTEHTKSLRLGPWLAGRVARPGPAEVPITLEGKDVVVPVRLNGILGAMVVRTNPNFSFVTTAYAKRAGVLVVQESPTIDVQIGGKPTRLPYARARAVEVGNAQVEGLDMIVYEQVTGLPTVDGILGKSFLGNFKVDIDRQNRKLTLGAR